MVGAMPVFWSGNGEKAVGASLPFFGSHGDALVSRNATDQAAIENELIELLVAEAASRKVMALNIIAHPFRQEGAAFYRHNLNCVDQRIGQISELPRADNEEMAREAIFAGCHQKTRNSVRKALKAGFCVEQSSDIRDLQELHRVHVENMSAIGGRFKSWREVSLIFKEFSRHNEARLYVATRDGAFAGALLLLNYGVWVEYFIPVISEEARADQVLSAIILKAMVDASLSGFRYWNWGGTWRSQTGVYRFKSRWGGVDYPYNYYGRVFDTELMQMPPTEVQGRYPHFYVRPFGIAG